MSKFFAIIVEDLGDENGKTFLNPEKFMAGTKVDVPDDCEILSCVEVRLEEVSRLLEHRRHPYLVRLGED
ncbi:MAG TPA: hypothetical protein VHA33_01065 [Candidatus Angelobacter sp.]|jgi:hypothetical protein|nr:hypothetical protein [Candidatus Angelobacter sp.]